MYQNGLSLLQLLLTLALLGILYQIATPSFVSLIESHRRHIAATELTSALRNARTEAILLNKVVVVQAVDDDWRLGWRTVVDLNGRGADDPSNPVLVERRSSPGVSIMGNQPLRRQVRFTGLGVPLQANNAFLAGTLHICDTRKAVSLKQVVLSPTGRVSLRANEHAQPLCSQNLRNDEKAA